MAPSKINTTVMPGDNMSPGTIEAAARSINTVGTKVSAEGAKVLTTWQKVSAVYHAPEEDTLFHAMNPVKTEAESFGTDVGTVSTALATFAEEVRTIKAAVATIRADAATFLAGIANGVEQDSPPVKGETVKIKVEWHEDEDTVAANNALWDRINTQQEALWTAERKCANAIYDTFGHTHIEAASEANGGQGYGVDQIPDNAEMPWGQKVAKTENCSEHVSNGLVHGAGAMAGGIGSLFGVSYSSQAGWDASWSTFGHAWKGVGMFGVGVATIGAGGLALGAIPGPVGKFFRDSQQLVPTALAGLVAIDLTAKDPLHKWKESGWEALGESIFNVGTLFVAPTKLGNVGRLGRVGEVAAKVTDPVYLAIRASQAVKTLSVSTVEALARLNRAVDLGDAVHVRPVEVEIPSVNREHVSTDVPSTGRDVADPPPAREYADDSSGRDTREDTSTPPGDDLGSRSDTADRGASHDADAGAQHSDTSPAAGHEHEPAGALNGHGDGQADAHGDGQADAHGDGQADAHGDGQADGHGDGQADGHGDGQADAHGDGQADAHGDGQADGHGDGQADTAPAHTPADDQAVKGPRELHTISSEHHAGYQDAVAERKQIAVDHTAALRERNALAHELGVSTKELSVDKVDKTLEHLYGSASTPEQLAKVERLEEVADLEYKSGRNLNVASEQLGMTASRDLITSHDGTVVVGAEDVRGRPHELDLVGVSADHSTMSVVEAKGGDSARLGSRMVDGVKTQQGSTTYLADLLHRDVRLQEYLRAKPEFAHQLATGEVKIEYTLVNARTNGTVRVVNFVVDADKLRLSEFDRGSVTAGR